MRKLFVMLAAVAGLAGCTNAEKGAVVGGVGGSAAGAGYGYTKSKEGFDRAYAACMGGKGYSVTR
jgi:hypothetical protein